MDKYSTKRRGSTRIDLKGERFGKLTVIERIANDKHNKARWLCQCDCGKKTNSSTNNLRGGKSKSCGCGRNDGKLKTMKARMIGKEVGRLKVISYHSTRKNGYYWDCECRCGNKIQVSSNDLNTNHTKSCGCILKEMIGEKHPRYNPELTDEERIFGRYELYGVNIKRWRNAVYKRDKYICQVCSKNSNKLHAHHLNSFHWDKDGRFDINNGVTMCEPCHKEFHSIYGYSDNNFFQFSQFQTSKTLTV